MQFWRRATGPAPRAPIVPTSCGSSPEWNRRRQPHPRIPTTRRCGKLRKHRRWQSSAFHRLLIRCSASGANDAWLDQTIMKKRPTGDRAACTLRRKAASRIVQLILRETTTIGCASTGSSERSCSAASFPSTAFGPVDVKIGRDPHSQQILNVAPSLNRCESSPLAATCRSSRSTARRLPQRKTATDYKLMITTPRSPLGMSRSSRSSSLLSRGGG